MDEQKKSYTSFAELKEACINFVKASKGRGAYAGLKKLLTELYPDKAHFVYELLQNAEDQKATDVEFILYNDKLLFRHNGKKRDFILSDIDSITNIGNSPTSGAIPVIMATRSHLFPFRTQKLSSSTAKVLGT